MKTVARLFALLAALCAAGPAWAYLGSFEPADGYTISTVPQAGSNPASQYIDVTYYNAGQWGANAGGGSAISIAPDSGLWDLLTNPGAYFRTAADRTFNTGGAPPYAPFPSFSIYDVPAYIIGNHPPGYVGGSALALRNEFPWNNVPVGGPMEYDYTLDTFDFGGPSPASVTGGVVTTSFRFQSNPAAPPNPGGVTPDKFIMTFRDSLGNDGLQIGYADDNEVYWRPGNAGSWNYTGIYATSTSWDQFTVSVDLTNDTFDITYLENVPNITTPLTTGTALGAGMQDLTHLRWWLRDQVTGGTGGKNFFDDFHVNPVPEPSSAVLLAIGSIGLIAFIKRRHGRRVS